MIYHIYSQVTCGWILFLVIRERQQLLVEDLNQPQLGAYNALVWRLLSPPFL